MLSMVAVAVAAMSWPVCQAGIVEAHPEVEIWSDGYSDQVYHSGDPLDIYIRPTYDCYVIVYEIDTDGYLRVLYPDDCYHDGFVRAGRVYRITRCGYDHYRVRGPAGVGYVHVVAGFKPFRTLYWHGCDGYEEYALDVTWNGFRDYWGCALPPRIHGDPYIAMQTIDEFICLDALAAGGIYADFTYYYVGERVRYPRYLCYDCHGYHSYVRPYHHACAVFSISFVDCDPWYRPCTWWWWRSPARCYCGPRYVCHARRSCRDYPSTYKWKTRSEAGYTGRTAAVRAPGGDSRYKGRSADVRDLYSRGDGEVKTREAAVRTRTPVRRPETSRKVRTENREVVRRPTVRKPATETRVRVPERRPTVKKESRKARPENPEQVRVKKESKAGRKPRVEPKKPRKAEIKSRQSRRAPAEAKRTKSRVAPKVRNKSKGKSPATRRRVSR
jgi:hypothetical protein